MSTKHNDFKNFHLERKICRAVDHTLRRYRMVQNGDTVLVAVSGGADSVALVHILLELAPKYSLRLAIAHLNHCLREKESDRDEAFVTSLAKKLELPFYIGREHVLGYQKRHRLSLEDAARQVRYRFYDSIAAKYGYGKIALGHHADDNAELVLMNLLRGSGPLGLSGISPVRDHKIIRPLINLRRSEIMDYVAVKKMDYVTDSSNWDLKFHRNKIRTRLIPQLKSGYNPKLIDSLNRLTAILGAEEAWIEDLIQPIYEKTVVFKEKNKLGLSLAELNQQPIAVRRRLIRRAILGVKGNLRRVTFAHIESVCQLAQIGPTYGLLDLPGRTGIRRCNNVLTIFREGLSPKCPERDFFLSQAGDYEYQLSEPGKIFIKEAEVQISFSEIPKAQLPNLDSSGHRIAFFDIDRIRFPLIIRNFRRGDRFSPLGLSGSQKLKKFFIDHKISRRERAKCPILLSQNRIIWVVGHRLDNSAKLDPQTRRILKAELLLA
ncbi:MAG: tRNA lysidine(34) synthetase TilS [Desulfobacterales bacterium]|jgi:tRNA(Ile)-lysidine synthase